LDVAAFKALTVIGLACLTAAGQARQGSPDDLEINAVRFYRAEAKSTQVKAFIQIPATLLEPAGTGPASQMTYLMEVRVRDSSGLELVHDNWAGHLPADARQPGATTLAIPSTPSRQRYTLRLRYRRHLRRLASQVTVEVRPSPLTDLQLFR
jgi:hypothetical protein